MKIWYVAEQFDDDEDDYCVIETFTSKKEAKDFIKENDKYNSLFMFVIEENKK